MTHAEALILAREIATNHPNVRAYCRHYGFKPSTVLARAFRAGVNLGAAVRACRVQETEQYAALHRVSLGRAALDTSWSTPSSFYRARRSVSHV